MVNYFLSTSVVDSNKFNLNLDPQFSLNLKSVESLNCEFCLQSYTFASNLSYFYWYGSGSVFEIRIWIYKMAVYLLIYFWIRNHNTDISHITIHLYNMAGFKVCCSGSELVVTGGEYRYGTSCWNNRVWKYDLAR